MGYLDKAGLSRAFTKLKTLIDQKADVGHTHTKSQITDFAHTHDDRYYTESEVDSKLNGKANSSHTHSYLPLSGGTVSGNVHFASIGDKAKAAGITWDGSTDGASIYYETRGSDSGHLVLNMKDDSNVTVDIAAGGAVQSYFGYDGTFHGNVSGNASSASSVAWSNVSGRPSSMPASDVYSWAKQPSKPSYTASEVGAFPYQTIMMPSTAEARYYLLATVTAQQRGNYRCSFSIASRHSGCGMVTVAFGNNTNSLIHNNMYAQIYYYGTTNQVTDSQIFQVYGSADGKHYYLFAKSWDYNFYKIRAFDSNFTLSRGDALTSIPTNTYGTLLCNTTINPSNSVSWNDVRGKPSTYAPSSHTHDDRYYTESEIDSKLSGKANSSHTHNYAGSSSAGGSANWANGSTYANYAFSNNGVSTSGNGSAYTANVSGFSLATGKSIVMIPHVTSTTTTPTLNVSGTGAKNIRMRLSSSTSSTIPLINSGFLTANKPVKVTYDGTYWVIDDFIQPDANNLYGTLISRGSSAPSSGTAGFIYIQTT